MINVLLRLIFILICIFLIVVYNKEKRTSYKKVLFFALLIFISLVSAYRIYIFPDNFGADYMEYQRWFTFTDFSNLDFTYRNFGFNLLICFVKLFSKNFQVFLFVCALIINYSVLKFITRYSSNHSVSLVVYLSLFLFSTFNGLRQWLACSIFLFSFPYIQKKSFWNFALLIFIASLFHDTALLLILLYPIFIKKHNFYFSEFVTIAISLILFIFCDQFVEILSSICEIFGVDYFSKYTIDYLISQSGNYTPFIISISVLVLNTLYYSKSKSALISDNVMTYYFLLAIPMALLASCNGIFNRYLIYFFSSIFINITYFLKAFDKKSQEAVSNFIILILVAKFTFFN